MATQGSPGRTRMAKNTMLMAPSSIGTATRIRRTTYCAIGGARSVEHFEHLRIVVAVVQRVLPVVGCEGRAHSLRIARPLAGHVADRQAHQVLLDALLGLGVDLGALLHVALDSPGMEQVIDGAVVRKVGPLVSRGRVGN